MIEASHRGMIPNELLRLLGRFAQCGSPAETKYIKNLEGEMKRILKAAAVGTALLLGCAFAPAAYAQDDTSPARITIFFATSSFDADRGFELDPLNIGDTEPRSTEFRSGNKFGLSATFDVSDHIGIEGRFSMGSHDLRVIELDEIPLLEKNFEIDQQQIYGNVLYYFTKREKKVRPYVTGGIGVTTYSPTADAKARAADVILDDGFIDKEVNIFSESKFGYNFGGGVEAKFAKHFGLRVDFRDTITDIPVFGVPLVEPAIDGDFYPVSGTIQNLVFSVGGVIFF